MTDRLRRSYQRWLLAYPADYRRTHGLEILTTLMDAARQIGEDLGRLAEAQDEVQRAARGSLLSPPTPT